ncbi:MULTISPECIES: hypothetical protein [unclassified Microcoleus]|uniref:hypothetical protein n=1 Tax=unclassified Microcoleus TaxID=2642155 RepID=UPI002FD5E1F1
MSIPKKGTRKIIVDGEPFVWLIRRQAANMQAESGNLHVAVEHADRSGSVLVIITDRAHSQGWNPTTNCTFMPVRPSDVAQWIRQAVQLGWQPMRSGITFQVQIAGGCAEKIY